jgi:pentatricopeptide repeat protein
VTILLGGMVTMRFLLALYAILVILSGIDRAISFNGLKSTWGGMGARLRHLGHRDGHILEDISSSALRLGPQTSDLEIKKVMGDGYEDNFVGDVDGVPAPLNNIIDINLETRGVIYECTLGRDVGIELQEASKGVIVGEVLEDSEAAKTGILAGDKILATSATAGENMWTHTSLEGIKAALNTRFVISNTVRIRFERSLNTITEDVISKIKVPYYYTVQVKRPIGLHVIEGEDKGVYVYEVKPELGAAKSRRIEVGDQVLAMSASWGDRMWDVSSIDSFVVGVKMRTDQYLSFRLKRMVSFDEFAGTSSKRKRRQSRLAKHSTMVPSVRMNIARDEIDISIGTDGSQMGTQTSASYSSLSNLTDGSFIQQIGLVRSGETILSMWRLLRSGDKLASGYGYASTFSANKAMTAALNIERADIAVQIFEETFGYNVELDPAGDILEKLDEDERLQNRPKDVRDSQYACQSGLLNEPKQLSGSYEKVLLPNNFVCTTAIKAYGHMKKPEKALGILPWLEEFGEQPDIYLMTALLYVCAKSKYVAETENLFWNDIPARNLDYTIATTNSLMYMYARLNRPDDALRVYEMTKSLGLKCTVITYGVLIKALIRSGKKALEQSAYDILKSLPSMDILPGVEIYNQFLEHYSRTHDYRQTKQVLKLMSQTKPRALPNLVSYGHLINCFASSKKPRSALKVFFQMRRRGLKPNSLHYMGVLKALGHMRDGISASQVIDEMEDTGISPDKRHFSMAMFAAIMSRQPHLVENLFKRYTSVHPKEIPDTALNTLLLRALLEQGRWDDAYTLVNSMEIGPAISKPNLHTLNYLLQYQIKDERWSEGMDTLKSTLELITLSKDNDSNSDKGVQKQVGGGIMKMRGVFNSLAFALGSYSSRLQRMTKEDQEYNIVSINGDNEILESGDVNYRVITSMATKLDKSSGGRRTPTLQKPSPDAFRFMVNAIEEIASTHSVIHGEFYTELLKALALEGFLPEAERLLVVGKSGLLRSRLEDSVKIVASEDLVARLLQEHNIKSQDP